MTTIKDVTINQNKDDAFVTDVNCVSRIHFVLGDTLSQYFGIDEYALDTQEVYCDVSDTLLATSSAANQWRQMATLPSSMKSVILSSHSYGAIVFDESWCYVFVVSPKIDFAKHKITNLKWVTPLEIAKKTAHSLTHWYGQYYCQTEAQSSIRLFFHHYDMNTGDVTAYYTYTFDGKKGTYWMNGKFDGYRLKLEANATGWVIQHPNDRMINLDGHLTLLWDGTILFAGKVPHSDCSAFILSGYVNPQELTADTQLNVVSNNPATATNNDVASHSMIVGIGIGVGITVAIMIIVLLAVKFAGYQMCYSKKRNTNYLLMQEENQL